MWRAQASPRAAALPSPLTLSSRRSVVAEPTRLERDTAGASGDRYETNERPPSTPVPLADRRGGVNGLSTPSQANGAGPAYGPKGSGSPALHHPRADEEQAAMLVGASRRSPSSRSEITT